MLSLYRRLLAYRKARPALQWGDYQPLDDVPETCYAFLRRVGDERVLVALNFSGEEQQVVLPGSGAGRVAISTHLDRTEAVDGQSLTLRGDEGVIVELSEG
jgi:glycosidase